MPRSLPGILGLTLLVLSPVLVTAQPLDRFERVTLVLPEDDAQ